MLLEMRPQLRGAGGRDQQAQRVLPASSAGCGRGAPVLTFGAGGKGVQELWVGQLGRLGGGGKHVHGVGVRLVGAAGGARKLRDRQRGRRAATAGRQAGVGGGGRGGGRCGAGRRVAASGGRRRGAPRRCPLRQVLQPRRQGLHAHGAHPRQLCKSGQGLCPAQQQLPPQRLQLRQSLLLVGGRSHGCLAVLSRHGELGRGCWLSRQGRRLLRALGPGFLRGMQDLTVAAVQHAAGTALHLVGCPLFACKGQPEAAIEGVVEAGRLLTLV
jgi:hypothetical protein